MPTYHYQREDGTHFELMQRMSDPVLERCPETGQRVKRIISGGAGVVYKGEGWYVTDYKNKTNSPSSTESASTATSTTTAAPAAPATEPTKLTSE
jgi:putative FmdB family regulatory protein